MTDEKVFLACYEYGVTRVQKSSDGTWEVEHLITDLKVTCLTSDPSDNKIVYAGTRTKGVWRSSDQGKTWNQIGMQGQIVKSLAVDPHNLNTIYAGSKPASMYKTNDRGNTWQELESFQKIPNRWWWFSPADSPGMQPYVTAISPSPTEPDVVLAGVELGAVVRSEDGGQTWSHHIRKTLRDCHSLTFHPEDGQFAYQAGGSGGGASMSSDGGRTWKKRYKGLKKKYGIVCGFDYDNPKIWYMCVGSSPFNAFGDDPKVYLYRLNQDQKWEPIGWQTHPLTATPTTLVSVPGQPGHLYVGLKDGDIWHTKDYGDNWEKMPFNLSGIWFSMLII